MNNIIIMENTCKVGEIKGNKMCIRDRYTFPLGASVVAGYINIPPYLRVRCTSATIDPMYLAPYGLPC